MASGTVSNTAGVSLVREKKKSRGWSGCLEFCRVWDYLFYKSLALWCTGTKCPCLLHNPPSQNAPGGSLPSAPYTGVLSPRAEFEAALTVKETTKLAMLVRRTFNSHQFISHSTNYRFFPFPSVPQDDFCAALLPPVSTKVNWLWAIFVSML